MILSLSFLGLLTSCEPKRDPEPEKSDPIYLDLQTEAKATEASISTTEKEIEEATKTLETLSVPDPLIYHTKKEINTKKAGLEKLRQDLQYYKIHAESRKKFARKKYLEFFKNKTPWPDKDEFNTYTTMKRLRTASLNWDNRVPKLKQSGIVNPPPGSGPNKEKTSEKAAKKEEGGKEEKSAGGHE